MCGGGGGLYYGDGSEGEVGAGGGNRGGDIRHGIREGKGGSDAGGEDKI